jgi:ribosome-binding factor A
MPMDEIRRKRVEDELRDLIASLILDGAIKDPRVGPFVSITRVEAARDLSVAKVYVSTFVSLADASQARDGAGAQEQDRSLDLAVEGLQRAAGFIQAQLARKIRLRLTPRLHFVADRGIKEGFDLTERIKGLLS